MNRLHPPAVLDQLDGEPIEQRLIRGRFAVHAEVETVGTSGVPKWRSQMWLIATRAASGLSGEVIQRASAVRRPVLVAG